MPSHECRFLFSFSHSRHERGNSSWCSTQIESLERRICFTWPFHGWLHNLEVFNAVRSLDWLYLGWWHCNMPWLFNCFPKQAELAWKRPEDTPLGQCTCLSIFDYLPAISCTVTAITIDFLTLLPRYMTAFQINHVSCHCDTMNRIDNTCYKWSTRNYSF